MPIHDWTRVPAGIYHHFHAGWIVEIGKALNGGVLPANYYALVEQTVTGALGIGPDVLALEPKAPARRPNGKRGGGVAVAAPAEQLTRYTAAAARPPAGRRKRVAVRHVSGHKVVALVELVSPGNKSNGRDFRAFVDKLAGAIEEQVQLLVVDPFPPTARDPGRVTGAVWKRLKADPPFELPADKPVTLAAFAADAGTVRTFAEAVAPGDPLPAMPLFLTPDEYVRVPLDPTYRAAWEAVPDVWRAAVAPSEDAR